MVLRQWKPRIQLEGLGTGVGCTLVGTVEPLRQHRSIRLAYPVVGWGWRILAATRLLVNTVKLLRSCIFAEGKGSGKQ